MRKFIIFVALCCIFVGVYFGFIHKPHVRILPGIEVVFTRDGNAADYYAKACATMSRRATDDRDIDTVTSDERKWFMLGTSCRWSSWYPEHYPHITDPNDKLPQYRYLRGLGRIMAGEGRSAEKEGDVKKAMDMWRRVAVLGWHTEKEEECLIQVLVGIAIEAIAYNEFIRYYRERGDSDQAGRYKAFEERLRSRTKEFQKLTTLETVAGYHQVKGIALSHKSTLWRKEACGGLLYYCLLRDSSLRHDAAAALTKIAQNDPDPVVRETARNAIPYALGEKSFPPELLETLSSR